MAVPTAPLHPGRYVRNAPLRQSPHQPVHNLFSPVQPPSTIRVLVPHMLARGDLREEHFDSTGVCNKVLLQFLGDDAQVRAQLPDVPAIPSQNVYPAISRIDPPR